MNSTRKFRKYAITFFRWLVKGAGIAILGLVLVVFVGEGPPNPFKFTARELLFGVGFLVVWVGLALAVWRQLIGG